jgi:hypothetical protein
MMARLIRFNIYFLLAISLTWLCGCQSEGTKRKHMAATLRLHLEGSRFDKERVQSIYVLRDNPLELTVMKESFLTEADVTEARIVEANGGFALSIHFDHRGQWLLEQYTAGNKGKRVVIESEFGPKMETKRWLAAPVISRRIGDGVLTFTPDASREETDQIVLGLNNVAKKVQEKSSIW